MKLRLACIVEGDGEREALPVLLRRILEQVAPGSSLEIASSMRVSRGRLLKQGELERAVELQGRVRQALSGNLGTVPFAL